MEKMSSEDISALTLITTIINNKRLKQWEKQKKAWLMNETLVGME